MEKTIKFPRRITEEEFLRHLDTLSPNSVARDFIMSFYERLKAFDDKNGKHLTHYRFGTPPTAEYRVYHICDQAKMLFFTEEIQTVIERQSQEYKVSAEKLKSENASEEKITKTIFDFFEKQERTLQENMLGPIGFADLFRFQFLNFVDEIVMGTDGGAYNVKNHKLTICNEKVLKAQTENPEEFWCQNIIAWHELVHLMQTKSYHNGAKKFLTPFRVEGQEEFFVLDGRLTDFKRLENGEVVYNAKALDAFKDGDWILNEILTEFFALNLWQTPEPLVLKENTYKYAEAPILSYVFFDKEKNFEWNTEYLKLSSLVEVLNGFYENKSHIISNPTCPPTWYAIGYLRDLFAKAKLSNNVLDAVNKNLAEIDVKETTEKFMLQKFLMILGRAAKDYETSDEKNQNPFNRHFLLAETLLLDVCLNNFKEKVKQNPNAKMQNPEFVKKLLNRQFVLHYWLSFPNKNIGTEENPIWAKRELSPSELFAMYPDNLLLDVWAGATEKMYDAVNKACPEKIQESILLKRTHEYLKNTKEIIPEK